MDEYYTDFPINHAIDLNGQEIPIDVSFLPQITLIHCNRLILSLFLGKDILQDISQDINMDGVTEKGPPFITPLVWVALLSISDWDKEKSTVDVMLSACIDCNYIGLCGFNLYHLYIVQSLLLEDAFEKLSWWVQHPMVNVNMHCLYLKKRPEISMLHPAELIDMVYDRFGFIPKSRFKKIIAFLLSRGMSKYHLHSRWKKIKNIKPQDIFNKKKKSSNDIFFLERLQKQWGVDTLNELICIINNTPTKPEIETDYTMTPTPQMNKLEDVPIDQHLVFTSSNGLKFGFHSSYMEMIVKTHRFPFTSELLSQEQIDEWLVVIKKKWMPREEFIFPEIRSIYPSFLSSEKYFHSINDRFSIAIHFLYNWLVSIYPYSRVMMLNEFENNNRLYHYMCVQFKQNSMFHFKAFQFQEPIQSTWRDCFFWSCYGSIHDGFPFTNQLEELISRFEINRSLPRPFHLEHPNVQLFLNKYGSGSNVFKIYSQEYDYTIFHVFYIFRQFSIFMNNE